MSSRSKKTNPKPRDENNQYSPATVSKKANEPYYVKSNSRRKPQNQEEFDVIKKVDNIYYDP